MRVPGSSLLHTVATVSLLMLGIGALGAMLALYRGTLAQPPPFANWERLVVLRGSTAQANRLPLSWPDFEDLRRDIPAFEDLALTRAATVTMEAGKGAPQRIASARVTPNLASVLGIALEHGVGFEVDFGQPADQVVISDRLWRGALGGKPIEQLVLRIGGRAVQIVGILPAGVRFPTPDIDLWMPLAPVGNEARRDYAFTTPWGVLRESQSIEDAGKQIDSRVNALAAEFPRSHAGLRIEPIAIERDLFATHRPLLAVFAIVGALVFIAVAGNVAALSAARELAHRGETATRLALGASPRRLLADALEAKLRPACVAVLGGAAISWGIVRAAEAADAQMFTALRASLDGAVLMGVALGVTVLFAAQLAPVLWIQRRIALGAPGASGRRAMSADRSTVRGAGLIVALQLAMCFGTVGTLVLARYSLAALERAELGFAADGRFIAALGVPELDHAATVAGMESALGEVSQLPGVEAAAVISRLPLLRGASSVGLVPASVGLPGETALPVDARLVVGPAEQVFGLRLSRGRFLKATDKSGMPRVALVDRRFADTWFAGRDPIGARVRLQIDPTLEWTIVGIIEPVQWRAFEDGAAPSMLLAAAQFDNIAPMRNAQLAWRGHFDVASGTEPLREALRRGMPLLSADMPRNLQSLVEDASGPARMATRLLRLLTAMALLLSVLGVGALLLYRFERQRRAVGIRLCLGASRRRVVGASLADGLLLAIAGAAAGAALIVLIQKLPETARLLPGDGTTPALLVAAAIVLSVACVGAVAPAWRIAHLEPKQVLQDGE